MIEAIRNDQDDYLRLVEPAVRHSNIKKSSPSDHSDVVYTPTAKPDNLGGSFKSVFDKVDSAPKVKPFGTTVKSQASTTQRRGRHRAAASIDSKDFSSKSFRNDSKYSQKEN